MNYIQINNTFYLAFIHNYLYAWDVGWIYQIELMTQIYSKEIFPKIFFIRQSATVMNERVIRKKYLFIQINNKIYLAFIHNYRYAWDVGWIYKTESMSKIFPKEIFSKKKSSNDKKYKILTKSCIS